MGLTWICLGMLLTFRSIVGDPTIPKSQANKGFKFQSGTGKNFFEMKKSREEPAVKKESAMCLALRGLREMSSSEIAEIVGEACPVEEGQSGTPIKTVPVETGRTVGTGCNPGMSIEERVTLQRTETRLNQTLRELEQIRSESVAFKTALKSTEQQLHSTELELAQTKSDLDSKTLQLDSTELELLARTKSDLDNKAQLLNSTELKLSQTKSDLEKKALQLNSTELELAQTKSDLENKALQLNSTELELAQTESDLENKALQLSSTEVELAQTKSDLENKALQLNSTELELAQIKSDLENKAVQLNSTELELLTRTKSDLEKKVLQLNSTELELAQTKLDLENKALQLNSTELELAETKSDLENKALQLNLTELELAQTKSDLENKALQLNSTELELAQIKSDLENKALQFNSTELELAQTKSDLENKALQLNSTELELAQTKSDLENKVLQLNSTELELAQTKSDLKNKALQLNSTELELAETKSDLENKALQLNSTELELAQTKSDLESKALQLESTELTSEHAEIEKYQSILKMKSCSSVTEQSPIYGDYSWTETEPFSYAHLPCVHNGEQNARKFCLISGEFDATNFTLCISPAAGQIANILSDIESVTSESQNRLSEDLTQLTAETGDKMGADDVKNIANMIGIFTASPDMQLSNKTLDNLISVVDNIQEKTELESMQDEEAGRAFRGATVTIASKLAKNQDSLKAGNSVGFGVAKVTVTGKSERKNLLVLAGQTNSMSGSTNDADDKSKRFFSAELETSETEVATAVYYNSDKAFPSRAVSASGEESIRILAQGISRVLDNDNLSGNEVSLVATLISDINIVDTNSSQIASLRANKKAVVKFKVPKDTELKVHSFVKRKLLVTSKVVCKFYNESEQDWSAAGCKTTVEFDQSSGATDVTCHSDHLTSFAVLMTLSSEQGHGEEEVSDVLLATSLVCLVLTLAAILPHREIMKLLPTKVNLMLVLALIFSIICFFLMDFFVSEEETVDTHISCSIIAFLLNYFWLCQLSWMVIEAVTMYFSLVKVFNTYLRRPMLKYSVAGWLLPAIFPLVGLVWGGSDFADPKTCFVKRPYGFVSFYGPVVVGVTINWILFFYIARVILSMASSTAKPEKMKVSSIKMRSRQLRSALIVSTFLGLGWITGFFLLMNNSNYSEINTAIRWLFILVNAPQGLFIFLFYVVLKDDVRRFWESRITDVGRSIGLVSSKKGSRLSRSQSGFSSEYTGVAKDEIVEFKSTKSSIRSKVSSIKSAKLSHQGSVEG